jgi:hypothetical protein
MSEVRRRCVFYLSGFDPKGAGHYHGLFKEQAALQASAGGLQIEVSARQRQPSGNHAWTVRAVEGDAVVETWYEFLRWDDIVRSHWHRRQWHLWRDMIATCLYNMRCGVLWKCWKLTWAGGLALTMPVILLIAALVGIPLGSAVVGAAMHAWSGSTPAALVAAAVAAALLVVGARKLEARYSMYWMMRSYAFTRLQAQGRVPELQERLDIHAQRVAQRIAEAQDDEVLVVGHSSGTIMAVSILARALEQLPHPRAGGPAVSLLTLGHCIPMFGLLPSAHRFRSELACLAADNQLAWVDFTAPSDGCCCALTDPVSASNAIAPVRHPDHPKVLSPRFAQMFDAQAYKELKKDKFRMHFQYLMASRRPVDYDYFRMTAGRKTLGARFAGVPSVSGYRGLRPFFAR